MANRRVRMSVDSKGKDGLEEGMTRTTKRWRTSEKNWR
jgi:hypothetical protein